MHFIHILGAPAGHSTFRENSSVSYWLIISSGCVYMYVIRLVTPFRCQVATKDKDSVRHWFFHCCMFRVAREARLAPPYIYSGLYVVIGKTGTGLVLCCLLGLPCRKRHLDPYADALTDVSYEIDADLYLVWAICLGKYNNKKREVERIVPAKTRNHSIQHITVRNSRN